MVAEGTEYVSMNVSVVQDLSVALKGALSGALEALLLGLMKSTAQYDASELKASMKVRANCQQRQRHLLVTAGSSARCRGIAGLTRFCLVLDLCRAWGPTRRR